MPFCRQNNHGMLRLLRLNFEKACAVEGGAAIFESIIPNYNLRETMTAVLANGGLFSAQTAAQGVIAGGGSRLGANKTLTASPERDT
jgi:hypothetical protein